MDIRYLSDNDFNNLLTVLGMAEYHAEYCMGGIMYTFKDPDFTMQCDNLTDKTIIEFEGEYIKLGSNFTEKITAAMINRTKKEKPAKLSGVLERFVQKFVRTPK